MIFQLTEEAQVFQDTLRRLFDNEVDRGAIQRNPGDWATLAKRVGVAFSALRLDEIYADCDGAAESLSELVIVAREIGRALAPSALLERIVSGPLFFSLFCSDTAILAESFGPEWVLGITSGSVAGVRTASFHQDCEMLVEVGRGEQITISGNLRLVTEIEKARFLLHVVGSEVYIVDLDQAGKVNISQEAVLDLTQPRVRVDLDSAKAVKLEIAAFPMYQALSRTLIAAEILGVCEKAFEMTTEYVKTRQQFSRPIGSFQAVHHAMADIYQKIEMLDSLVCFSIWALKSSAAQSEISSQSLIRFALREGGAIVEKAIQLHGGIGFTWEHDLHLYLRRVRSLVALAGSQAVHDETLIETIRQATVD